MSTPNTMTAPVAIKRTNKSVDLCALPEGFRALLSDYKKSVVDFSDLSIHYAHEMRQAQAAIDAAAHIPHAEELGERAAAALDALKEERAAALATARTHTPDLSNAYGLENLYACYKESVGDSDLFADCLVDWFGSQFDLDTVGMKTVRRLVAAIGAKKATANQVYKTGNLTAAMSRKAFADLFVRVLIDEFSAAGALPKCDWTYAPAVEQAVKDARAAKKNAVKA